MKDAAFTPLLLRLSAGLLLIALLAAGLAVWLLGPLLPPGPVIAYMGNQGGDWDLYLLDVQRGLHWRLTQTPRSDERFPDWSPDGRWLMFAADRSPDVAYDDFNLHRIRADGSQRQALPLWREMPGFSETGADWAPDGTAVAFFAGVDSYGYNLFIADPAGESFVPVTAGDGTFAQPAWSPDGRYLLLMGDFNRQLDLYLMDISAGYADAATNMQRLTPLVADAFYPAWSPDGQQIVFAADFLNGQDIFVMTLATRQVERLTDTAFNDTQPAWSPDGRWIAFASDRGGHYDLYRMRPDGSDLRRLTWRDDLDDLAPDWRP